MSADRPASLEEFLTAREAGDDPALGRLGERYIRRLIFERRIPVYRPGGRKVRLRRSDVLALFEAGRDEPDGGGQ